MTERRRSALNLGVLLSAAEAAPPVAAADVIASALADTLGGHDVSFLIADYSGQSLIRLGQADADAGSGHKRSEAVPLGSVEPVAPVTGPPRGSRRSADRP